MFLIVSGLLSVILSHAAGVPVAGYPDSLQNLGYGTPYGGNGDSGYGNEPANYDFQYEVYGGGNFFGHQESRRDEKTNGKYHVLLPDGRRQIVTYVADETGYHPTITYEVVANPTDSSGGYGGNDNKGHGGYGGSDNNRDQGGYGGNDNRAPNGGYGSPAPLSNNNLGSGNLNRYSSRIKRQFYAPEDYSSDLVKIYRSESNPTQRFRNRRRRHSAPKKGYLIVYPDSFQRSTQEGGELERTLVPES